VKVFIELEDSTRDLAMVAFIRFLNIGSCQGPTT